MAATPDLRAVFDLRSATISLPKIPQLAHLVGVCGSGMSALASLLVDLGWSVSGSDVHPNEAVAEHLRQLGIDCRTGHEAGNVPPRTTALVYSAAVPADNVERRAAQALRIPELSYSQMVGDLMRSRRGVCIAGTHGKSTTAAMTATILQKSGRDPSVCLGAELCDSGRGGWAGMSDLFVVESCEYRSSFLDHSPTFAAILSVEPDHFDCFQNFDETREAFRQFAARVDRDGTLLVRKDCAAAVDAARATTAPLETFCLGSSAFMRRGETNWLASDLWNTRDGIQFRVFHNADFFSDITLRVPGRHNVLNALAAIALCHRIGLNPRELRESLAEYRGIRRRFEYVGWWRSVLLLDDYAHHPTAIRLTLQSARERFGRRRIWCVFQPHQVSRTRALMMEFAESFGLANEVLIAPVYAVRETADADRAVVAKELSLRIAYRRQRSRYCCNLDQIVATLDDEARPGDIVITMGAGDINRVHYDLTRRLEKNRAS
jgi:UDP-N-acetylmuramate--alanine ligase